MVDGERGCGNGMAAAGGPAARTIATGSPNVDALIINGGAAFPLEVLPSKVPAFDMRLDGATFYALREPARRAAADRFERLSVHAIAAIGNPQRFFNHLHELGISFTARAFPGPSCVHGRRSARSARKRRS